MQIGIFFLLLSAFVAAEDACPSTEIVKFAELYANPHLHPCQKVSAGFSLAPPKGYPTDSQVQAMCASDDCHSLIEDVLALEPADCYLSFAGVKLNAYKMACSFKNACNDKSHEDDKHGSTPKPTKNSTRRPTTHYPTPKPTDEKYYPKPTENDKHYSTPKPTDEKYYPTPKPTDDKYPKPTEDDKHYRTPKPTEDKYYPTPKPTDDKDHHKLDEPMIVKTDHDDDHCPTHCAENEKAKEADNVKPPMNGTALELFPMPNTTYKATASPKA
ncbi:hypothetical protein F441_18972 [Phytophthora nicotianae CJ01A1]|uniref:Elicitin-like protein n=2 Tax=Phytophthora nicotianae TaxID=4792 RepID=V9E5N7_PHYNI|nr:hypothetical protein F443_19159 [Phytophthora nicotianae P1569]ETP04196.1 hypothetical protein F441_18972 [Phytophthora nicotianae CJ01A1]